MLLTILLGFAFIAASYADVVPLTECGFEANNMCAFTQGSDDSFDWRRHTGRTGTWFTGPEWAHKGNYYAHIESNGRKHGDEASLVSPPLQYDGVICVDFFYHMYGSSVNELRLEKQPSNNPNSREVFWSKSGDQGKNWVHERVTLTISSGTRVVFTGVTGSSNWGDIAIDTVLIHQRDCSGPYHKEKHVVVLLDVSLSVEKHLTEGTSFLNRLYDITSTDEMFDHHPSDITVIPFDSKIREEEVWGLEYENFQSAEALRNSQRNGMADFIEMIEHKQPDRFTNIGEALIEAYMTTHPDHLHWMIIIVSDFINIAEMDESIVVEMPLESALEILRTNGIHVFPVLVDKEIRNETTFEQVKLGSLDDYGLDMRTGITAADVENFYTLTGDEHQSFD